ncbi:MAG: hypothetical protein Q7S51_10980 [Gallionellaceae bacterium]|nr:hypothetical protein [Gallionellaceae bacterium]
MKKIILALASVLTSAMFAPEASAVPAFARQMGMACSGCHFQSFPILTSYGKSFKMGGFTEMGTQGKIEGDQGLSIPDTLNMAVVMKVRYQKTNGPKLVAPGYDSNNGRYDVPDEFALFAAGRVAENIGALIEVSIAGAAHAGIANFKVPFVYDLGSAKLGVVPFSGDAGAAYGFDLFATGSNTTGRAIENGQGYSAARYLNTHTEVTGAAIYVANADFHINVTPWFQGSQLSAVGTTEATALGGRYLRAAWTPSMAGWDLGLGVQRFSGNSFKGINGDDASLHRDSATIIDFQGQGAVADLPLGVYGSYGFAKGSTAAENLACAAAATLTGAFTGCNTFNDGTERRSAFGLLADLGVIPETLGVQFGIMRAKTGILHAVSNSNESDNGITLGLRYKIRQNMSMGAAYTKFSGTAYNAGGSKDANAAGPGNSILNLTFFTGF